MSPVFWGKPARSIKAFGSDEDKFFYAKAKLPAGLSIANSRRARERRGSDRESLAQT